MPGPVELGGVEVKTWWAASTVSAPEGGTPVLLVWRDDNGLLRRRTAPLAELDSAADVVLMDTAEHGGPTTLDLEATFGRTAAVFLFRGKGFHALRMTATETSVLAP